MTATSAGPLANQMLEAERKTLAQPVLRCLRTGQRDTEDLNPGEDLSDTCGHVKVKGVLGAQRRNISGRNATKIFAAHLLGKLNLKIQMNTYLSLSCL